MWDEYLYEDIQEEFSSFQPESVNWAHFDRSVMEPDPATYGSDEIDMQEWQRHIQMTTPISEFNQPADPTCLCVSVTRRRWKNQHANGFYTHVNTSMRHRWSDQDLEEMSHNSFEVKDLHNPLPETPKPPTPAKENQDSYPVQVPSKVRVQISMKQKGKDVKGQYENFEISNIPIEQIFASIQTLLSTFPKCRRKDIHYYTRIQLQNKINGKMQGGRNLSLHNATPQEVAVLLEEIFDRRGWLVGAVGVEASTGDNRGFVSKDRSRSEDGSPKPGNHWVPGRRGRGVIYQSQNSAKRRTTQDLKRAALLAELEAIGGA